MKVCRLQDHEYPNAFYDRVVPNPALHYVEDLDNVYRRIRQTCRPGGVFLMNIEHPSFTAGVNQQFAKDGAWPVDDYPNLRKPCRRRSGVPSCRTKCAAP